MTPPAPLGQPLAEVHAAFKRWLYLPDSGVVSVALGTVAANMIEGRPVWLLIVGAPASGKTEALNALAGLPNIHHAGTLTEASLLSGTPKREKASDAKGGLLRKIGEFGILVCKDFTSILSMNRDARAAALSALREIHDGAWTRQVGTDGGRELAWSGKLGFLGGVTPVIDSHHAVMHSMGERFLLYRLPTVDEERQSFTGMDNCRQVSEMTADLNGAVRRLFASGLDLKRPPRDQEFKGRVVALAALSAKARSAVYRDGRTREIELIPPSEMPARLAITLAQLDDGMAAIGVDPVERWRLLCKTALDCIPELRRKILFLLQERSGLETGTIAEILHHPTQTVRFALQDLTGHKVCLRIKCGQGLSDLWTLTAKAKDQLERARIPEGVTVHEMSGDED